MKLPTEKKSVELDFRKYKWLIYGQPGAGKSTFASKFPDAIFIPTEPGLNFLECFTIVDDEGNPKICRSWPEFKDAIRTLTTEKHNFKTIVIDTIDNAHKLCSDHVTGKRQIEHESDESYGKGWKMVQKEFEHTINQVANSEFGLVFISHEKQVEKEEDCEKFPYTDNTLGNGPKKYVNGLVDFIFYGYREEGKRLFRTKSSKNINAKDRTGILSEIMPMSFTILMDELKKVKDGLITKIKGAKK